MAAVVQPYMIPQRPSYPAHAPHSGSHVPAALAARAQPAAQHRPVPVRWRNPSLDGGVSPQKVSSRRPVSIEGASFYRGERPVATPLGLAALWGEPSARQDVPAPPPPPPPVSVGGTSTAASTPGAGGGTAGGAAAQPSSPHRTFSGAASPRGLATAAASYIPAARKESFVPPRAESFAPPARRGLTATAPTSARTSCPGDARRGESCSSRGQSRGPSCGPASAPFAAVQHARSPSNRRHQDSASTTPRAGGGLRAACPAVADTEDLLDQHVRYYLRRHPREAQRHVVTRLQYGLYEIDGHQVEIEWQYGAVPGQPGHLLVVDGPLRQPFGDYLEMNEATAEYDTQEVEKTSALHHVPKERRMTFDDTHKKYTRLEAMKVAKEQANLREKAADYTRDGKQVPDELVRKYNKALRQKLRHGRAARADSPRALPRERGEPAAGPAEPPGGPASGSGAAGAAAAAAAMSAAPVQQQAPQEPICPPPVAALMAHRGISLNGLPSYLPPQTSASATLAGISRSWSGTNMPSSSSAPGSSLGTAPSNFVAMPGVAMPAPLGQVAGTSPMASVCLCPQGPSPQPSQHAAVTVTAVPMGYYR
uniref:Uncharacterized protein n=1 Tax=Alexandrium monilatum TaxID=311494 RepID=A0A7S4PYU0_9DINO